MALPFQQVSRVPQAPVLPPGTYAGAYAAQGLRSSNPQAAAQLWESRHPGAVNGGNLPPWVMQALQNAMQGHQANVQTPQGGQQPVPVAPNQGQVPQVPQVPQAPQAPQAPAPGNPSVLGGGPQVMHGAPIPAQNPSVVTDANGAVDPHATLANVVNAHRQATGQVPMHPEDLHARVTSLAHEILNGRSNRLQQALRGIRAPAPIHSYNTLQAQ